MNFRYIFTLVLIALVGRVWGQQEIGLNMMPRAIQSNWTNPALKNEFKFNFAFPGIYVNAAHTGFALKDLVQAVPGTDSLRLDVPNVLAELDEENYFRANGSVEALALSFRILGMQFMLGARERFNFSLGYPKDLLRFAWEGNGNYIGESLDLGLNVQAQSYHELSLGASIPVTRKIRAGARLKYLIGLADISMAQQQLALTTHPEYYQLQLDANYGVRMSQVGLGDLENPSFESTVQAISGNRGLGVDLGLTAEIIPNFILQASVIDLGSIHWKENSHIYTAEGQVRFDGLDPMDFLDADSLDFTPIVDSLMSGLTFSEENTSYRTPLNTQAYLGLTWKPIKSLRLSFLGSAEYQNQKWRPALSLGASKDFFRFLTLGAHYGYRTGRFDNLGANLMIKLGPTAVFVTSDNIIPFIHPEGAQTSNLRVGMNLMIGKNKK